MRKNRMMRLASALLILTMVTTCAISGTFAKYVTEATGTDTARVAYWGFNDDGVLEINNLFVKAYKNDSDEETVNAKADTIAPGTTNSAQFEFTYTDNTANTLTAPEVDYSLTISVAGSSIDAAILNNANIQWKLDDNTWGTWADMMTDILQLSGSAESYVAGSKESVTTTHEANNIPAAFASAGDQHTIEWQWLFTGSGNYTGVDHDDNAGTADVDMTQDEYDTWMANKAALDDVTIKITITATQLD